MHPEAKLRHIRTFLDITAAGTLTAVARTRAITPPVVSRTLAELEDLPGATLFLRVKRGLILTENGMLFRQRAASALPILHAVVGALHASGHGGRLRFEHLYEDRIALVLAVGQPDAGSTGGRGLEQMPHGLPATGLRNGGPVAPSLDLPARLTHETLASDNRRG